MSASRKMSGLVVALAMLLLGAQAGSAQGPNDAAMVGQDEQAWQAWTQAMQAINRDAIDLAKQRLADVAQANLSPLRLALMADRTGTLRFAQAIEDAVLDDTAKALMQQIGQGRRQRALVEDGWHYAAIGRFDLARANFEALLQDNPDPIAVLELASANANREAILLQLMDRADIGPAAVQVLNLLKEGRFHLRTDPGQIVRNVAKLSGSARERLSAVQELKRSGEWAVPFMLDVLLDSQRRTLHTHVIAALEQIGKAAVTPLSVSLQMDNNPIKVFVIRALGRIGYPHAAPYLKRLIENENTPDQVRQEAQQAIQAIEQSSGKKLPGSPAEAFFNLSEAYYYDRGSLVAEPDAPVANLWFWREGHLISVPVPPVIFNELMSMRSAETALELNHDFTEAVALWIAANFKREAQLGVGDIAANVPDPATAKDPTHPTDYPRAIYFARAAGPRYNHLVLARGLKDADPGVILGAIAALRDTAGASSLIGSEDYKQPLVRALTYRNLLVRIQAALALGNALPTKEFAGAQNVVPALSEALAQTGAKHALVIEPDEAARTRLVGALREAGFQVIAGEDLYAVLEEARKSAPSVDLIVLASSLREPAFPAALAELTKDYLFASAATVLAVHPAEHEVVQPLLQISDRIGGVPADAPGERLLAEYDRVRRQIGALSLDAVTALRLAIEAAEALRLIAVTNNAVYDFQQAEAALVRALGHPQQALRVIAAEVLAESKSPQAQQAVAGLALDDKQDKPIRLRAFAALADSAKTRGNLLTEALRDQVIAAAMQSADLEIRTAASQALGALNLPSNQASRIIRAQVLK